MYASPHLSKTLNFFYSNPRKIWRNSWKTSVNLHVYIIASPVIHFHQNNPFESAHFNHNNLKTTSMNSNQSASYQAGQAKGQAEEKGSQLMDKAGQAAQSAQDSAQQAGQQMKAGAQGAADAAKDATGMNK